MDSGYILKIRVNGLDRGCERENSRMIPRFWPVWLEQLGRIELPLTEMKNNERSGLSGIVAFRWSFHIQVELLSNWLDHRVWSL